MEKEIPVITKGDFVGRFKAFLDSKPSLRKCQAKGQTFTELITEELSALRPLLDKASGKVSEMVLFEGVLALSIVNLTGTGKLPLGFLDCAANYYSSAYDSVKRLSPEHLQPEDESK